MADQPDETNQIESVLEKLKSSEWRERAKAIRALGTPKNESILGILIRMMAEDPQVDVRYIIPNILAETGHPEVIPALRNALSDSDEWVRSAAAKALNTLEATTRVSDEPVSMTEAPPLDAVESLVKELNYELDRLKERVQLKYSARPRRSEELAEKLGELGDKRAFNVLSRVIRGPLGLSVEDLELKKAAVRALGNVGDPRAVELLLPHLQASEASLWFEAARSLGLLGWQPTSEEDRAKITIGLELWEEALKLETPTVISLLLDLVRSRESRRTPFFQAVISVLKEMGSAAIPHLLKVMDGNNEWDQLTAIDALELIGGTSVVEPVIRMLGSGHYQVRRSAAFVLGRLGDSRAIEPLKEVALHDPKFDEEWHSGGRHQYSDPETGSYTTVEAPVRFAALFALEKLGLDSRTLDDLRKKSDRR